MNANLTLDILEVVPKVSAKTGNRFQQVIVLEKTQRTINKKTYDLVQIRYLNAAANVPLKTGLTSVTARCTGKDQFFIIAAA
jgi:hypothetical protein